MGLGTQYIKCGDVMSEAKIKEMQAALKQSPKEITFSDYCAKCPLKLAKDEYVAPKK